MKKYIIILITVIVVSVSILGLKEDPKNKEMHAEFRAIAPLPTWWDEVDIGNVHISNYDELMTYWQSEKRCCSKEEIQDTNRQFFKAMYFEILDHIDNPDIVVNAIDMMTLSHLDYEYFYPLTMFALNSYPNYKKPLHGCVNCMSGDVLANMLEDLRAYAPKDKYLEYIDLVNNFLNNRGLEMSDYYEARVYLALARAYEETEQISATIDVLTYMLERYKNSKRSGSLDSTLKRAEITLNNIRQKH